MKRSEGTWTKRCVFWVALLSILLSLVASTAEAEEAEKWAAIAYSATSHEFGWVAGLKSQAAAEKAALRSCADKEALPVLGAEPEKNRLEAAGDLS